MFSILDIIGLVLRGAAALGLAAFCGWSSVFLGTGHAAWTALLGQGGQMVLVVMGAVGAFAGFYCLVSLSRETRRRQALKSLDETQHDFDPDAIIARHVAWRAANPPAAARRARNNFHQPPRPVFGRRVV
jgi:hypothetical protein